MQILPRDVIISFIIVLIVLLPVIWRRRTKGVLLYALGVLLLTVMMAIAFSLAGITPLSGFHPEIRIGEISFVPFAGMVKILQVGSGGFAVINLLGNLLMFAPLGFLLPLLCPRLRKLWKTALWGLLTSLLIECTQLFLSRGTDVDDLILNTAGAALGYAVFQLFRRLFPRLAKTVTRNRIAMTAGYPLAAVLTPYFVIIILGSFDRAVYFAS